MTEDNPEILISIIKSLKKLVAIYWIFLGWVIFLPLFIRTVRLEYDIYFIKNLEEYLIYILISVIKMALVTIWAGLFIKKLKQFNDRELRKEFQEKTRKLDYGLQLGIGFIVFDFLVLIFYPLFIVSAGDFSDPEFIEVFDMNSISMTIAWGIGPFIPAIIGLIFSLRSLSKTWYETSLKRESS